MYLKSIEINGFKSFANKLVFKFENGITGIVGPNGSGKSNVADAVRWVLGEQSASRLRGKKMEDVIFAGTEARKPQGSAYVAITLDNSDHSLPIDYTEVTVARRVYRSGESEYLINGTVSKLKDVTALFFDTGIGKEGYSIIGQGQVERILSDKPDERRALFDEAAGIVKYKKNKQITEKQLADEHDNLNRVNDILSGLEERVGPLAMQAEKAKQYLKLKDDLKKLDINSFLLVVDSLRAEIKEIEDKQKITQEAIAEKKNAFEETKVEYERLEAEIENITMEMEGERLNIHDQQIQMEHASGEIRVMQEKIASVDQRKAEMKRQINILQSEKEDIERELSLNADKVKEIEDTLKLAKEEESKARENAEKISSEEAEIEGKIQAANSDILEFMNAGSSLKEKQARYDTMLENIDLRKIELKGRYLSDKSQQQKNQTTYETLVAQQTSVNDAVNRHQKELTETETNLRNATDRASSLRNQIDSLSSEVIRLRSQFENLRNLSERYEGYGNSIRKVMEQKDKQKGVLGVVADIIKVDEKYETAIETALGGSIQNIVTEDEDTAKRMIAYLRNNKFGRATFLPITTVKNRGNVDQNALKEAGVIGVASQLVKTDSKFTGVIESLLGRSIVVEDIDAATRIAKKYHQSLRLVTPSGELINPGGAMTGGAFRNNSNLLGRKRELDEITKSIGEKTNELRASKEEETSLQMKRESLKESRNKLQAELNHLSIEQNSVKMQLENCIQEKSAIEKDLQSIEREQAELEEQISTIAINKDELLASGKEQEASITERKSIIDRLNQSLVEKRTEKINAEATLSSANLNTQSIQQNYSFANAEKNRIEDEIRKNEAKQREYQERLLSGGSEAEELTANLAEQNKLIDSAKAEIEALTKKLEALKEKQTKVNASHKEFFEEREKMSTEIAGLEKTDFTLGMKLEKLNVEKDEKSDYMWNEYELTYSSAEALKVEGLGDEAELKRRTSEVRRQIKGLGDVNVGAIEEYAEVNERYTFLKTQHDDIIEAENNLKNIIAELDVAMKRQFAEKFKDIQVAFGKVFKELFGGGKGTLTLVDEDDLLETGIMINAQPPGKKLQNMMQLSGGEKSLTAISLLFAIQSLKPSPFCILDEIEAALDDSNVGLYAQYLHRLTKHTQFIVITHRKGTMEAADVLYGITMQEKGVSTLVSVSMIEDKLDK